MFGLLLALLILDGIFMSVVILLQSGKGGGLAAMGGAGGTAADNLIGGRQAATLLTKATWVSGGLFLGLALVLSVMSTRSSQASSVLEGQFQEQQTTPTPLFQGGPGGAVQPEGQTGGASGEEAGASGATSGAGAAAPDTSG